MTFIVTAVSVEARAEPALDASPLVVRHAAIDEGSWARAGFIPGLTRYLGRPVNGSAYHVLIREENGYESSNPLFQYSEDDDQPARLDIQPPYREPFDRLIRQLLTLSRAGEVLLVAEYNGQVSDPDLSEEQSASVDVIGPLQMAAFWMRHDLGEIPEDSLTLLVN